MMRSLIVERRAFQLTRLLALFAPTALWVSDAAPAAGPYFVDNGRDDYRRANGSLLLPFEQIQQAADRVQPGEIVYVRRTELPYQPFKMKRSGTPAQPIRFLGYHDASLASLEEGQGVPREYTDIHTENHNGRPRDSISRSPEIQGPQRATGPGEPVAVDFLNYRHIELANFWISHTNVGIVLSGADHCIVRNVYVFNTGDPEADYDGRGITLRTDADENQVIHCTFYNAGQEAVTLIGKSDRNRIEQCRVFSDDDSQFSPFKPGGSATSLSATHYYFIVEDSNENTFVECSARRYPDPVTQQALRHVGHGFVFQANGSKGEAATGNQVLRCDTLDIGNVIHLRWTGVHGNRFEGVVSRVENEADDDSGRRSMPLGRICLLGGPHRNIFRNCQLLNADMALAVFGHTADEHANQEASAASFNRFENCVFQCELAMMLSDFHDERTAGQAGQNNNLQVDGTQQWFRGNVFDGCQFLGDPKSMNRATRDAPIGNCFFHSARGARDNSLRGCTIRNFDRFSEGTSGQNSALTPLPIVGGDSFRFSRCRFQIDSLQFWWEPLPSSPRTFGLDDLGRGNRLLSADRLRHRR